MDTQKTKEIAQNGLTNGHHSPKVSFKLNGLEKKNGSPTSNSNSSSQEDLREGMTDYWKNHSTRVNLQEMMLDETADLIHEEESAEILSMLPDLRGKTVLELGAGIGRFTGKLAETAQHVIAVDFMESFINKNKEDYGHNKNIEFLCSDVTKLKMPAKSVDIVFSNWLFMYLSDKETKGVFKNILNWLKDDGMFFLRESCFHQSGNMKRDSNPTKYRDPVRYTQLLHSCIHKLEEDNLGKLYEIIFARPVRSYIKHKNNANQLCWLLRSKSIEISPEQSEKDLKKTEQEFLDSIIYRQPHTRLIDNLMNDEDLLETAFSLKEKKFYDELNINVDHFVLDVGCGSGIHSFLLAKHYSVQVLGVDLSSNQITLAMLRNNRINDRRVCFEMCNLRDMPYPSELADIIHCRDCLHHIKDKENVASNFFRILKSGGRIFLADVTIDEESHNSKVSEDSWKRIYPHEDAAHFDTSQYYKTLLATAGFTKITHEDATELALSTIQKQIDDLTSAKESLLVEHSEKEFEDELQRRHAFQKLFKSTSGLSWSIFYASKP